MGSSASHIVPLKVAKARCGAAEIDRFSKGFERICDEDEKVDPKTFQSAVLGMNMPVELARRIFKVFDRNRNGKIEKTEFICGMALFSKGTPEERVQFLFEVYDEDSKGWISKSQMRYFLKALRSTMEDMQYWNTADLLEECFYKVDKDGDNRLSSDEFQSWALKNMTPGLVTWVFDLKTHVETEPSTPPPDIADDVDELASSNIGPASGTVSVSPNESAASADPTKKADATSDDSAEPSAHTPKDQKKKAKEKSHSRTRPSKPRGSMDDFRLASLFLRHGHTGKGSSLWRQRRASTASTHFDEKEGTELEKQFHKLRSSPLAQHTKIIKEVLGRLFTGALPNDLLERVFGTFAKNPADEEIVVDGFISGLSICCRGSLQEKSALLFRALDGDQDDRLSADDISEFLTMLWHVGSVNFDGQTLSSRGLRYASRPANSEPESKHLSQVVANVLSEHDTDSDGFLDREGLGVWVTQHPFLVSFFDRIRQFACIHLGVRPSSPREEQDIIVRNLVDNKKLRVGKTYFILSAKWRDLWCQYVGLAREDFHLPLHEPQPLPVADASAGIGPTMRKRKGSVHPLIQRIDTLSRAASDLEVKDAGGGGVVAGGGGAPLSQSAAPAAGRAPADEPVASAEDVNPDIAKGKTASSGNGKSDVEMSDRSASVRPGPIDNSTLIKENCDEVELKRGLRPLTDFSIVPEEVWTPLVSWYGGSPAVPRIAIRMGREKDLKVMVELDPLVFTGYTVRPKREAECTFSRAGTVGQLKVKLCSLLSLAPNKIRLWDDYSEPRLLEDEQTLEDAQLVDRQRIHLEKQTDDGGWPGYPNLEKRAQQKRKAKKGDGRHNSRGVCGLYNLGNTCFMNASVQCLKATMPLTRYFQAGLHVRELNDDNPLGLGGKMALQYGRLLRKIWKARMRSAVVPRGLKWTVGKFAPRFVGYQQQDAQELLGFLLDGLHEDLNRVKEKPYVPNKDSDNRPDEEVAAEYWENYLKRNRSVIVDLFCGQLRSEVTFDCGKTSVVFDPYFMLSLPLPKPKLRYIEVVVIFDDAARTPMRYSIGVSDYATNMDFRALVGKACGLAPDTLYLADVYNHLVYNFLNLYARVTSIRAHDTVYAYEVPHFPAMDAEKKKEVSEVKNDKLTLEDFQVGQCLDVRDTVNKWIKAEIVKVRLGQPQTDVDNKEDDDDDQTVNAPAGNDQGTADSDLIGEIFVHYVGWHHKWDEWVDIASDRVAPLGRFSTRQTAARVKRPLEFLRVPKGVVCLHALHRLLEPEENFFLRRVRAKLLGAPMLLFVDRTRVTGAQLYEIVWQRVRRYTMPPPAGVASELTGPVMSSASTGGPAPESSSLLDDIASPTSADESKATEASILPGNVPERAASPPKAAQSSDDGGTSALPPFVLKYVKASGTACSKCNWLQFCMGHTIEFSDEPLAVRNDESIAVDWNPVFYKKYFQQEELDEVWDDTSVEVQRQQQERAITFADCMREFTTEEKLSGDSAVYCSDCKTHQDATKSFSLWSAPPVLVIHLKRGIAGRKLHTLVDYPLRDFDPSAFYSKNKKSQDDPPKYDLYGVVNHFGSSGGGHYVAFAKAQDEKWYKFDDRYSAYGACSRV